MRLATRHHTQRLSRAVLQLWQRRAHTQKAVSALATAAAARRKREAFDRFRKYHTLLARFKRLEVSAVHRIASASSCTTRMLTRSRFAGSRPDDARCILRRVAAKRFPGVVVYVAFPPSPSPPRQHRQPQVRSRGNAEDDGGMGVVVGEARTRRPRNHRRKAREIGGTRCNVCRGGGGEQADAVGATWLCGVRDVVAAQEGAHHEVNNVELENTRLIQRVQDLAGELARLQEASAAQATSVQATQEALRDAAVVESSLRGDLATANARAAALQQQLLQVQSQRSDQEDQHHQAAAILEAERRQSQRIVEELQVR